MSQLTKGQTGIDTQDEDAEAWARREGHNIIAVVADHKSGASDWMARPNLRPWLTEPDKLVRYKGIVAAKQDRLSRGKWRDETEIRKWAEDNGKELFIIDSRLHWPPRDAAEWRAWEMGAIDARIAWEKTSTRYRRMQRWLRDNDYFVGRPPYWCRIVPNGEHKTLEHDPVKAPIVLEMIQRYLDGETLVALARWLEVSDAPYPTRRGTWHVKTVNDILRSENLIGRVRNGDGKVVFRFEAIIDIPTWRKLQALLEANARRRGKVRFDPAMLTGVLYCGKCGRIMHARHLTTKRRDGSKYIWHGYRCDGTQNRPSTCKLMVPMDELDEVVDSEVIETYGSLLHVVTSFVKGNNHQDELDENAEAIAALDVDAEDYDRELARLRAERKRLQALPAEPDRLEREPQRKPDGQLVTVAEHWATLDKAGKRDYLLDMRWRVLCFGRGEDGLPGVGIESQSQKCDVEKL